MTIRELPPTEWDKVAPFMLSQFKELPPDPQTATIIVAEENGQVVAFLVGQMLFHAEPLWISESHRGHYLIPLLVNKLQELLPNLGYVFAHCDEKNSRMQRLLEHFGLTKMPWTTFRWIRGERA